MSLIIGQINTLLNSATKDELHEINRMVIDRIRLEQARQTFTFHVGEDVWFYARGRIVQGRVTKINRTTIKVLEPSMGMNWKCAPGLVNHGKYGATPASTTSAAPTPATSAPTEGASTEADEEIETEML